MKKLKDPFLKRESEKYDQPIPSREYILSYLLKKKQPLALAELLKAFHLKSDYYCMALQRRLKAMVRDRQLNKLKKGLFWPTQHCSLVPGRITRGTDKQDWLIPTSGEDRILIVYSHLEQEVREGDEVLVSLPNLKKSIYRQGEVVELIQAKPFILTGRFIQEAGIQYVIPQGRVVKEDILIPPGQQKKAKDGEVVLIEMLQKSTARRHSVGRVIEVLGNEQTQGIEIEAVIRRFELPFRWSSAIKSEVSAIKKTLPVVEQQSRLDLRAYPLVTIDGEDAQDFDDAVFCQPRTNGGYTLYVAIADVSFYVKENTQLDQEAYLRGNSVYFPGKVIPMLPEKLSNQLCSLTPDADKLCMVCILSVHKSGKVTRFEFQEALMRSKARLTYTEVAKLLTKESAHLQKKYQDLLPHLQALEKLYELLKSAREARGAIDFETVETRILFNKKGKIQKIEPVVRNVAHKIIEECMLAANVATAKFLKKHKLPGVYRIHEGPTPEKLHDLVKFLNTLGFRWSAKQKPTPQDYAQILKKIQDRDDSQIIQMILLRSLSQAIYSPDNIGHFGLAYDAYTHFTSPIRRYPDLLVHRLIRLVLQGKWDPKKLTEKKLAYHKEAAYHSSMTERRADEATRDVTQWLKCQYLKKHVGDTFKAVISGVVPFGFFAQLADLYMEGLVRITDLHGDFYQYDSVHHRLVGERSGVKYQLGDTVTVQVAKVDVDGRQVELSLLNDTPKKAKKSKKSFFSKSKRKSRKK